MMTLHYAFTVEDMEHWPAELLAEVDACTECFGGVEDHATHLLDAKMRAAGEEFIKANEVMFRVPFLS